MTAFLSSLIDPEQLFLYVLDTKLSGKVSAKGKGATEIEKVLLKIIFYSSSSVTNDLCSRRRYFWFVVPWTSRAV
jgi:hypothetical protein